MTTTVPAHPVRWSCFPALALACALLMAGCGSAHHATAPSTAPSVGATATSSVGSSTGPRLPTGFVNFVDRSQGFSIATPSTWQQIDTASAGAAAQLQSLVAKYPDLQSAYGDLSTLVSTDVTMVGIDASSNGKDAANMNVIVRPEPGITDGDLPQVLAGLKTDLAQSKITVSNSTTVTLAGHKALENTLAIPITDTGGAASVDNELQDVVGADNDLYLITFGGTGNLYATIASTFSLTAP